MPSDRLERSGLNRAWIEAEAALPLGWHLDSLRCTSTGLAPELRSDRWLALATGPKGETLENEGNGPLGALQALARDSATAAGIDERLGQVPAYTR